MIWPLRKRARQDTQTGIVLDPHHGGSAAVVHRQGSRLRLRHCAVCLPPDDGNWRPELAALLADHSAPVNAVVPEEAYQLLLVERPDVPAEELAGAVRWRIRELINTPVEESVVDVFDVPAQARGSRNMVYAVAAQSQAVGQVAEQVRDSDLPLQSIDIAELCMRNIATELEQDRFGVAFLLVRGSQGFLTITRDRKLYVIRQMEIPGGDAGIGDEAVSAIALELQRSLDYFESHYDQRPIRDVVLAPSTEGIALSAALGREMAVNVTLLDLNELLETPRELSPEEQSRCLLAVGAALRGPDVLEQAA
ncbi:MAG: hypothetical protein KJO54_05910 [Gammaproteobacteria bacterium]|nr:hypothetical protein [Gammaproteobacteria bacterium]NNF60006.1 hypothetical protein [Gammaproteobacteria bacterium]NNM20090.1 hypothetical protein [Gammaproteobacteria bacterium]